MDEYAREGIDGSKISFVVDAFPPVQFTGRYDGTTLTGDWADPVAKKSRNPNLPLLFRRLPDQQLTPPDGNIAFGIQSPYAIYVEIERISAADPSKRQTVVGQIRVPGPTGPKMYTYRCEMRAGAPVRCDATALNEKVSFYMSLDSSANQIEFRFPIAGQVRTFVLPSTPLNHEL